MKQVPRSKARIFLEPSVNFGQDSIKSQQRPSLPMAPVKGKNKARASPVQLACKKQSATTMSPQWLNKIRMHNAVWTSLDQPVEHSFGGPT
jgi:hypothetical protein